VNFLTLVQSRNPALSDVRVREAIALGIGRAEVAKAGPLVTPTTSLVPDSLPGFDASIGFREDIPKARRLMAEAGYPGGKGFPTLSILTTHDDPYVRAVVQTLHRNLGVNAKQEIQDPGVESVTRTEVQPESFVGYFSTAFTGILTWQNWVSNLYSPTQTKLLSLRPDDYTHYEVLLARGTARSLSAADSFLDAHASPQSRHFAAVAARADATASPGRATALYKQAAGIRQGTYEFVPYGYGALVHAVRPSIEGVHLWTGYFTISFKGVSVR
jgi:ABC-type transport system substrate-binding protein